MVSNNRYSPRYSNILDKDNAFTGTNTFTGSLVASGGIVGAITVATTVTAADESADTTCFPAFFTAATGDLPALTGSNLTFNASTGQLEATILSDGTLSSTGGTVTGGVSISSTNFVGALAGDVTGNVTGDVSGVAMATEEGTGWAGAAAVSTEVISVGKRITTQVFVDIEGLVVSTTVNDIVGDSAAPNCYACQFVASESGTVYTSGSITCLEAPVGADLDIDFTVAVENTGTENADVGGLTSPVILLANGEAWTLGMTKAMALLPDATSDFLYLSNGVGGIAGTYSAGQFLIELIGYEA